MEAMKNCNNCLHYDFCNVDGYIDAEDCKCFKSKADFVEVVYCKDCQWATKRINDNELFKYQCRNTIACGKPRREVDFCSYGERKEDV